MTQTTITLADIDIRLRTPREVLVTDAFRPFLDGHGRHQITVEFQEVDHLPSLPGRPVFENLIFQVYADNGVDCRLYRDHKEADRPYAVGRLDLPSGKETVQYLAEDRRFFSETQNCFSHIALEELLLSRDRLILHASYIATSQGAILFSGPSGIGKSTQAALWERYMCARLINGDRTVLSREANGWTAHGSPYAGSSRCFVNESHPLRAVVMLEQGSACGISRLSLPAAFQRLYAGTTINSWNASYVARVCDLLTALAAEVPVYHLVCTPDEAAVRTLAAELRKEGC